MTSLTGRQKQFSAWETEGDPAQSDAAHDCTQRGRVQGCLRRLRSKKAGQPVSSKHAALETIRRRDRVPVRHQLSIRTLEGVDIPVPFQRAETAVHVRHSMLSSQFAERAEVSRLIETDLFAPH